MLVYNDKNYGANLTVSRVLFG